MCTYGTYNLRSQKPESYTDNMRGLSNLHFEKTHSPAEEERLMRPRLYLNNYPARIGTSDFQYTTVLPLAHSYLNFIGTIDCFACRRMLRAFYHNPV